ncbi:MAG: AAA family ATPase [Thainema sp.]
MIQQDDILLEGFGFSGYRSFGNELVKIAPLRKINLVIGQNNIGKSNIINFLKRHYPFLILQAKNKDGSNLMQKIEMKKGRLFSDIDRPKYDSNEPIKHKIAFPLSWNKFDDYIIQKSKNKNQIYIGIELAKKALKANFPYDENHIWFVYGSDSINGKFELVINVNKILPVLEQNQWYDLWNRLTASTGGGLHQDWIPQTMNALSYIPESIPNIEVVPAIRKIGQSKSEELDFSGEGIIERLAKIQNPSLDKQEERKKFIAINEFIQNVLENPTANIEIPHERDMILVHMDGKTLPLESLGTGVHEVIILAAAATLLEKTVLCVEEPELHLHPLLQKKLLNYLFNKTNNQYLFTTHSAHLLDAVEEAEIFHVTQKNGESIVEAVFSTKQKSNICNDLGYKASDILQANCIIWVEGPSDRIYINYWLNSKRKDLVEGIHYSIMFYGGRLFSHLTALDDDEVAEQIIEDLISVRNLNRNAVIVFDSDKPKPQSRISRTKKRLEDEFNQGPGFAWITKGREIENYLDMNKVEEAVLNIHSKSAKRLIQKDRWSNLLKYEKQRTGEKETANKVKVAQYYTKHNSLPDFNILDLNKRLDQLIKFILESNGYAV